MQDHDAIEAGQRARAELELTEAAFEKVRGLIVERLLATSIDQQGLREKLYLAAQTCDAVRRALADVVANGEIAEVALAKEGVWRG